MTKSRRTIFAVVVAFAALAVSLAGVLSRGAALRDTVYRNCVQIETLKAQVRPEPFNEPRTRRLLVDLGIDPGSEAGKRLIREARQRRKEERAELAPGQCNGEFTTTEEEAK